LEDKKKKMELAKERLAKFILNRGKKEKPNNFDHEEEEPKEEINFQNNENDN
jgi:hypothetical protein